MPSAIPLALALCLTCRTWSQDLPQQQQLTPGAKPPPALQPPRPQDYRMPVSRDFATSEFYLRATDPAAHNLAPFPLPLGYPGAPVGYLSSPVGPTTGQTTPLQNTGPHDPTGLLFGQGPNFTADMGAGAMVPIYQQDVPANPNVTFAGVVEVARPNPNNPLPAYVAPGCLLTSAYACSAALSACLGGLVSPSPTPPINALGLPSTVDIAARSGLCACYAAHSACWQAKGCIDNLPRSDVDYCFYTIACPMLSCQGSGAAAGALAGAALALAAASAVALALG